MADVVVVLPGILGSTLTQNGSPVWAPSPRALLTAVFGFRHWASSLTLPEGIGDDPAPDGVAAAGLMPDVHALPGLWTPVKGYDRLIKRLRHLGYHEGSKEPAAPPGNLLLFPYDWRLSNRYIARRLGAEVQPFLQRWRDQGGPHAYAQVVFVAHSMGGLIARRYVECEHGADHTRRIISLGTPYRGAAKALVQLVNGMPRLLGPLADDLTGFARAMPSLHQLLPEYACLDTGTGPLLRTTDTQLPDLNTNMVLDAMAFHTETNTAAAARPASGDLLHAIVGTRQPTTTTVRLAQDRAEGLHRYRDDDHVVDDYGDATVPAAGALPHGLPLDTNLARRIPDQHGNLQRNTAALDEVEGVLKARAIHVRDAHRPGIRVAVDDLTAVGRPLALDVAIEDYERHRLQITVTDESGRTVETRTPRVRDGQASLEITLDQPGAHTIDITTADQAVAPVSATVLAWPT